MKKKKVTQIPEQYKQILDVFTEIIVLDILKKLKNKGENKDV